MTGRQSAVCLSMSTRLGVFQADENGVIVFPTGLPGFEDCRRFVLMSAGSSSPFYCLQGADGARARFLSVDPRVVLPGYKCELGPADAERLRATDDVPLLWLALLTVDKSGQVFANLRAPVVINPTHMVGAQVLPHDALYALRHPVAIG